MNSFGNQVIPPLTSKISVEQRHAESPLATPAYRMDIYNILYKIPRQSLLNNLPQATTDTSKADQLSKSNTLFTLASNTSFRSGNGHAFTCNNGNSSNINGSSNINSSNITNNQVIKSTSGLKKTYLRWLFKLPAPLNGQPTFAGCEFIATPENPEDSICDITIQALSAIGGTNEASIAVTEAFEKLLIKEYIPWWTPEDIASLSIPFIAAFDRLLGGLDLAHAIRSRILSPKDINLLINIPDIKTTIIPILELYQDPNP